MALTNVFQADNIKNNSPKCNFTYIFLLFFFALGSTHDSTDCWSAHRSPAARESFKCAHDSQARRKVFAIGAANWGRRVGKGVIIISCADPVHGKKFPVITMIPTKTLTAKIIHKHNFIGCDTWSLPPGDHLHHGGVLFNL